MPHVPRSDWPVVRKGDDFQEQRALAVEQSEVVRSDDARGKRHVRSLDWDEPVSKTD